MGKLIVINAPTSFTAIWAVTKPWLSPRTLDKISILGANQYHAVLLDLVPRENLPASLGGTCACDGGCALSNAGPWMDDRRAERRALWLSGELAAPGMPWPSPSPPSPPQQEQEQESEAKDEQDLVVDIDKTQEKDLEEELSCHAVVPTPTTPSPSWGRVTLPLPLPHPSAAAAVRLVA
jgi:CRAL/TRIO domain